MDWQPPAPFPSNLAEITPAWLTGVLRRVGVQHASSVQSGKILAAHIGDGMVSQISRLGIAYDRPETGQPPTLIAKRLPHDARLDQAHPVGADRPQAV